MRKLQQLFLATLFFTLVTAFTLPTTTSNTTAEPTEQSIFKIMEVTHLWDLLATYYEADQERDDTWLDVGWRSKYAMAKNYASISILEETFEEDVFLRGPHHGDMDFNSTTSFGYYNPRFLDKVHDALDYALSNPIFSKVAEPIYKKHFQSMAHTYYDAFLYMEQNPEIREQIKSDYIMSIAQAGGTTEGSLQEKFRGYAEKLEKGDRPTKVDIYEAFTAPSFWIRRYIDGTEDDFLKIMELVVGHFEGAK